MRWVELRSRVEGLKLNLTSVRETLVEPTILR